MIAILLMACADRDDPVAALPREGFISADSATVANLSACLAAFTGSEAASLGASWRSLAAECPAELSGGGSAAWRELACVASSPAVRDFRGDAGLAFGWSADGELAGRGRLWSNESGLRAEALAKIAPLGAVGRLFVPGDEPAGRSRLVHDGAVLHARARPAGGIDVSALVEAGSQADTLFGLKGALLSRAVLAGDWELVAYGPAAGGELPLPVLALGLNQPAGAAAVESFAVAMAEKWNVERRRQRIGVREGECLAGLRVLPQLEPCFVATEEALVVGWNADAVARALGGGATRDGGEAGGWATIDFASMAEADDVFAASRPPESTLPAFAYPLRRVEFEVRRVDAEVRIDARSAVGCGG